jgi:8-oxo-dGTP diphosphatase
MSTAQLAALMIFERDGKILLLRRNQTAKYAAGLYTLPSGRVEENESMTAAAIREALEEVGLTAAPQRVTSVHILHRKKNDEVWIDGFFCCTKWSGVELNKEPEKCDDVRWFPINRLPENIIPFVREVLQRIFKEKLSYSEYGWC